MREETGIQQGWEFSARLAGADAATRVTSEYVSRVSAAIDELSRDISMLKSNQSDAVLGGYIAEHWHAGTFNIDAIAGDSAHRAFTLGSTEYASVDIGTNFGKDYSAKYMATPEKSAVAQSLVSSETGGPKYQGQERLIPTDHIQGAKEVATRRAASNAETRPGVAAAYEDAKGHFADVVADDEGHSSIALSKEDDLKMARELKRDELNVEDYGANLDSVIKTEYIVKQAVKAGYTAAAVTVAIQMAPEIYKAIDHLIRTGQIDIKQLKSMGPKAISAGAEGFLRGSVSCSVLLMCEKGLLGEAFRGADPTMVGTIVAVVMETVKNSIMVAAGKMTVKEMGAAFTDSVIVSAGYIAGAKIGGIIGQAIGFELPVVGYLIGSLVGCAFAAVYNVGKKQLISFCVDTGFTCFGLVEQNYVLPDEVLASMGIKTIPVPRMEVARTAVKTTQVTTSGIKKATPETIGLTVVRRGIIGVNKVGYVI